MLLAFTLAFSLGLVNVTAPSVAVAANAATTATTTAATDKSAVLTPGTDYSQDYQQYLKDLKTGNTAKYREVIPSPFAAAASLPSTKLRTAAPPAYNPLTQGDYLPAIKDQGYTGTCWAFGSVGLADIYGGRINSSTNTYSEEHMRFSLSNKNTTQKDASYYRGPDDGGSFEQAAVYMTNWDGMVLDSAAPFNGSLGESWPTAKMNAPVVDHVTGTASLQMNQTNMKNAIMQYGAVNVTVNGTAFTSLQSLNLDTSAVYSSNTNNLIYHSVLLVGWDDAYAVSNFNMGNRPSSPGAWLVRNSWGTEVGDGGYYWISYQDAQLVADVVSKVPCYVMTQDRPVSSTETIMSNDHMPQWGRLNMGSTLVYAANTYQMKACATVSDVMFYAEAVGAKYSIYVVPAAANGLPQTAPSALGTPRATGTIKNEGYLTATLTNPYLVPATGKYAVVVAYNFPSVSQAWVRDEWADTATEWGRCFINAGESSYSTGSGWGDLASALKTIPKDSTESYGNFCIRAIVQAPVPTAPTIVSAATAKVPTGTSATFQVTARGTDTKLFSLTGAPAGFSINASTGLITVAPSVALGTYSFTVSVTNGVAPDASQTLTLTIIPATPVLASLVNSATGPLLKWNKAAGASGYYVWRKTGTGSWANIKKIAAATTLSYTDTTAVSGTSYSYSVQAYGGTGPLLGTYNTTGLKVIWLATPKLTSAVNASTGVKFTWGKVSGATGYLIYRKTGTGAFAKVKTITSAATVSWIDTTAKSGTTYTYSACAYKTSSANVSTYNTTGKKVVYVAMPKLVSLANSKSGPVFKWGKVTGATGYIVYRKTTGGWVKLATIKSGSTVSYTDKKAVKGKTYSYTVRAYKTSTANISVYNTTGKKIKVKK